MGAPRFRLLPHTADVRLAVWGGSEESLLRHAVLGALALALGAVPAAAPRRWIEVRPWPAGLEARLVRAVNEALFRLYVHREVATGLRRKDGRIQLGLAPLRADRQPAVEVKAATFHALAPRRAGSRLRAVLTLDL